MSRFFPLDTRAFPSPPSKRWPVGLPVVATSGIGIPDYTVLRVRVQSGTVGRLFDVIEERDTW